MFKCSNCQAAIEPPLCYCGQSKATHEIVTQFIYPPIPTRNHDWIAVQEGYEPPMPIGYGATEAEAIADLIDNYDVCCYDPKPTLCANCAETQRQQDAEDKHWDDLYHRDH